VIATAEFSSIKRLRSIALLLGDIHVYPRWNRWVLQQFAEGNNGLSTEFKSLDKDEKFFIRIIDLNLERVAVVPTPAAHVARMF